LPLVRVAGSAHNGTKAGRGGVATGIPISIPLLERGCHVDEVNVANTALAFLQRFVK
jgi:hypothetical protein